MVRARLSKADQGLGVLNSASACCLNPSQMLLRVNLGLATDIRHLAQIVAFGNKPAMLLANQQRLLDGTEVGQHVDQVLAHCQRHETRVGLEPLRLDLLPRAQKLPHFARHLAPELKLDVANGIWVQAKQRPVEQID